MGAVHTFDLTANVTHLIVSTPDTEKYRYVARERNDMKVLQPDFIDAVRIQWMSGGNANIQQLEDEYRFRTFQGTKICVTGWDDYDFRIALEEKLRKNGASFQRDLTKEATHLVAKAPTGRKFEFATLWGAKIVSLKWIEDSLSRGMILDENRYHPSIPLEKQGMGAWRRPSPPSENSSPKRPVPVALPQRARKIRRVASMKLGSQSEDLWGAIMAEGNEPDALPAPAPETDAWKDDNKDLADAHQQAGLAGSEDPKDLDPLTDEASIAPTNDGNSTAAGAAKSSRTSPQPEPRGFWHNCRFFIYGFTSKETDILVHHLTFRDAEIVKTSKELASPSQAEVDNVQRYVLIPFACSRQRVPSLDDLEGDVKFVNDLWVEKCLHYDKFIAPEEHAACTPFKSIAISGFRDLNICSTGFTGIDLLHVSKIVNLMGAKYNEYLTPSASILICDSMSEKSREKLRHVSNWNVPAVSPDWLWDSISAGTRQPYEKYLLQKWSPKRKAFSPRRNDNNQKTLSKTLQKTTAQVPAQEPAQKATRYGPFVVSQEDHAPDDQITLQNQKTLSPKPHPQSRSPHKPSTDKPNNIETDEQTTRAALDNAINTLFRKNSKDPTAEASDSSNGMSKKRRRLLGRASSNGSSTLTGYRASGRSREQSVDTANGDVNGNHDSSNELRLNRDPSSKDSSNSRLGPSTLNPTTTNPYMIDFEEDTQPKTQLRYQDPDVAALKAVMMPQTTPIDKDGVNKIFDPEAQKQREMVAARLREGLLNAGLAECKHGCER
ncbi:hypothetical protein KEM56_006163 [Ascosphaera pollenicola]|nr:hypothetical protein KEM56_006163 [Ascosphaera pollenicola]